ncbi:MAG: NAD-dependent epimerase/dehydratase family protein [Desulfatiglandaceae bacterium]
MKREIPLQASRFTTYASRFTIYASRFTLHDLRFTIYASRLTPCVLRLTKIDLTNQDSVRTFIQNQNPEYVFLAAARVGGIMANDTYPADFSREERVIYEEG